MSSSFKICSAAACSALRRLDPFATKVRSILICTPKVGLNKPTIEVQIKLTALFLFHDLQLRPEIANHMEENWCRETKRIHTI